MPLTEEQFASLPDITMVFDNGLEQTMKPDAYIECNSPPFTGVSKLSRSSIILLSLHRHNSHRSSHHPRSQPPRTLNLMFVCVVFCFLSSFVKFDTCLKHKTTKHQNNKIKNDGQGCVGAIFFDSNSGAVLGANFMKDKDVVFNLEVENPKKKSTHTHSYHYFTVSVFS